jgi:ABC-type branched-subunit amino acid transport system ATPase component
VLQNGSAPPDLAATLDAQREPARAAVETSLYAEQPRPARRRDPLALAAAATAMPMMWALAVVYGDDITSSLGRGAVLGNKVLMIPAVGAAAALLGSAYLPSIGGRVRSIASTSLVAAALLGITAVAAAPISSLALVLAAAAAGAGASAQLPLFLDLTAPAHRLRALAMWAAIILLSISLSIVSPLLSDAVGVTWRVAFLVVAVAHAVVAAVVVTIVDPGAGHWENAALAAAVPSGDADRGARRVRFGEAVAPMLTSPSTRPLLQAVGVLGVAVAGWMVYVPRLLEEAWQVPRSDRLVLLASVAPVTVVLMVGARRWLGGRLDGRPSADVVAAVATLFPVAAIGLLGAGLSTVFSIVVFELVVAVAVALAAGPVVGHALLGAVPPTSRPHAAALLTAAGAGGVVLGLMMVGSIDARFGPSWAVALVGGIVLSGSASLRRAGQTLDLDVDGMTDSAVEEQTVSSWRQVRPLPLLACRGIDVSYGSLQVLFGVNLTVAEGEMVALLGTNGAGKSTLLRAISGLVTPQRGTVRLGGDDITFLAAERRVAEGIVQVPGGRAVFGPLSVVENLRLQGYAFGRDRTAVDAGIDEIFSTFPRLGERRNQPASTLSGGEQQMVALGKALMLRPKVLLIDELSLGLAPIVVGELLEIVRTINDRGTAVVLVEQSVNIALTLAHHAYFMEKGEMRFDGPSDELLRRGDLLRSVFLGGAAAASAVDALDVS